MLNLQCRGNGDQAETKRSGAIFGNLLRPGDLRHSYNSSELADASPHYAQQRLVSAISVFDMSVMPDAIAR